MSHVLVAGRQIALADSKVYDNLTSQYAKEWDLRKCNDLRDYLKGIRQSQCCIDKLKSLIDKEGFILKLCRLVHPLMMFQHMFTNVAHYDLNLTFGDIISNHFKGEKRTITVSEDTRDCFNELQFIADSPYDPEEVLHTRFNPFFPERGGDVDIICHTLNAGDHSHYEDSILSSNSKNGDGTRLNFLFAPLRKEDRDLLVI